MEVNRRGWYLNRMGREREEKHFKMVGKHEKEIQTRRNILNTRNKETA